MIPGEPSEAGEGGVRSEGRGSSATEAERRMTTELAELRATTETSDERRASRAPSDDRAERRAASEPSSERRGRRATSDKRAELLATSDGESVASLYVFYDGVCNNLLGRRLLFF